MYSLEAVILVYGPTSWFRLQGNELSVNNTNNPTCHTVLVKSIDLIGHP